MKNKGGIYILISIGIAAFLAVINYLGWATIDPRILMITRWIRISGLIYYAILKKSLTTWILVSMVVGAALGNDVPDLAVNLRVLSQIFLKMIKTIIAPLLFGTLVEGLQVIHISNKLVKWVEVIALF